MKRAYDGSYLVSHVRNNLLTDAKNRKSVMVKLETLTKEMFLVVSK